MYFPAQCTGVTNMSPRDNLSHAVKIYRRMRSSSASRKKLPSCAFITFKVMRPVICLVLRWYFYFSISQYLHCLLSRVSWHTSLTADLSDQLETVQKRALRIIFGGSSFTHHSYESFCYNLEISPLSARRDQLATHFSLTPTPNQLSSSPSPS